MGRITTPYIGYTRREKRLATNTTTLMKSWNG